MKGLVLAFAIVSVIMLLIGCIGYEKTPMPGSDRDAHGCIGSAGYSWCEPLQQCIRSWETNCSNQVLKYNAGPAGQQPINASQMDNGTNGLNDTIASETPEVSLPKTIDKICHDEVVDAWCSTTTYVEYQVLTSDGRPTGHYQTVVALYNHENVTANCTVQFVRIPDGGIEQFTEYTAVLGPYATSQNYSITSPNSYASREEFSGTMVQRVCKPYPGN